MDKAKDDRLAFEETVEVVVGTEQSKFVIHTTVFCHQSRFIQSACSSRWNTERNPITLPDTLPQTFSDYLNLVYRDKVTKSSDSQSTFERLIRLYILADQLEDLESSNKAIDKIIKYSDQIDNVPNYECIALLMEETPENSSLRRWMIDFYVYECDADIFDEEKGVLPVQFLTAVARKLTKLRQGCINEIAVCDRPQCHYHQHDDFCPPCVQAEDDGEGLQLDGSERKSLSAWW